MKLTFVNNYCNDCNDIITLVFRPSSSSAFLITTKSSILLLMISRWEGNCWTTFYYYSSMKLAYYNLFFQYVLKPHFSDQLVKSLNGWSRAVRYDYVLIIILLSKWICELVDHFLSSERTMTQRIIRVSSVSITLRRMTTRMSFCTWVIHV